MAELDAIAVNRSSHQKRPHTLDHAGGGVAGPLDQPVRPDPRVPLRIVPALGEYLVPRVVLPMARVGVSYHAAGRVASVFLISRSAPRGLARRRWRNQGRNGGAW
jgi:hypothetical protein